MAKGCQPIRWPRNREALCLVLLLQLFSKLAEQLDEKLMASSHQH
jgi:hypothetical protein